MLKVALATLTIIGFIAPGSTQSQTVEPTNSKPTAAISTTDSDIQLIQHREEMLVLINEARQELGLEALSTSTQLNDAAQKHIEDVIFQNNGLVSHTGSDGSNVAERVERENYFYQTVGENIAAGSESAAGTFEQWMNSQGHRENMLNPDFSEAGIGYFSDTGTSYGHYWVLVLGRSMSSR
ncbi:MAG: CAP domain-containing protein [Cyanobacteria bacterium P01_D01_bin.156]